MSHHFIEGSGAGGSYLYELNSGKRTGKCMTDRGVLLPTPHHLEKTNNVRYKIPNEQRPKPLVSRTKHTQGMHIDACLVLLLPALL